MKLITTLALASVAMSAFAQVSSNTQTVEPIKVLVDGIPVVFQDVNPIVKDGRVMVPLRGVFEKMGADVTWNSVDKTIVAVRQPSTVWMQIGLSKAKVDERWVELENAPMLYGRSTMIPLRFVSESLGASVYWNSAMAQVEINTEAKLQTKP